MDGKQSLQLQKYLLLMYTDIMCLDLPLFLLVSTNYGLVLCDGLTALLKNISVYVC